MAKAEKKRDWYAADNKVGENAEPEAIPARHARERGDAFSRHDNEHSDMRKRHAKELETLMERHAGEIDAGATLSGPVEPSAAPAKLADKAV